MTNTALATMRATSPKYTSTRPVGSKAPPAPVGGATIGAASAVVAGAGAGLAVTSATAGSLDRVVAIGDGRSEGCATGVGLDFAVGRLAGRLDGWRANTASSSTGPMPRGASFGATTFAPRQMVFLDNFGSLGTQNLLLQPDGNGRVDLDAIVVLH